MAKNTFYIRASVNALNAGDFKETEIDLGSYTNLGSSKPEVLRIHNATVQITSGNGIVPTLGADLAASFAWQLTTQSQSALIEPTDDSWVSGGRAGVRNPDSAANPPSSAFEQTLMPQDWTAGAVIAVPSLFLGGFGATEFTTDVVYNLILECSTEPMSKANAVSLAISQQ
tara:strand:- start:127 stop:639 length:513 start_codon:yes stop_codon:yes gene_type:complete